MLIVLLLFTCLFCALAYKFYGNFLDRRCRVDKNRLTPAESQKDGMDFVPTRASVVFGHHFSSIAGTGPIVGPIFAAIFFGWGPAWIWILIGAVFVGGVHDFGSTIVSLRNQGKSIAEVSTRLIGPWTGRLFMVFVLAALTYVLVVFLDLTASNFVNRPAVATSSGWFIVAAVLFGWINQRQGIPFWLSVLIFVPLTFLGLVIGHYFPAELGFTKNLWLIVLLGYCLLAAVLPVNLLLQPRDFLSSFFLYAILLSGILGVLVTAPTIQGEFFTGWTFNGGANPAYLVPTLFITVACGACSGFHSIVSSGTTSKQLKNETDVRKVSYGAMLVEGILATLSLGTLIVLTKGDIANLNGNPNMVFAHGFATFLAKFGVSADIGIEFALLGLTTFLLTTLDTCTRLCRFLIEELFGWQNLTSRYLGTALVLLLPAFFCFQTYNGQPAWRAIWPMFGATNQLLAGLALITFVVYLRREQIRAGFALIPALLMLAMPLIALVFMMGNTNKVIQISSMVMFALGIIVAGLALKFIFGKPGTEEPAKQEA